MDVKDIIKDLGIRIEDWKEDRRKIGEDKFRNYLHSQLIDHSIDDIVIVELTFLLNMIKDSQKNNKTKVKGK